MQKMLDAKVVSSMSFSCNSSTYLPHTSLHPLVCFPYMSQEQTEVTLLEMKRASSSALMGYVNAAEERQNK